ncbi:MAG: hypothetical protein Q4C65_01805 [Eubacteriales bacterium]|nr:hypothetical protein [Eubacteriales bacterium]
MGRNINVEVDASKSMGIQEHLWRFIGYDECNYTYIPEGVELLRKFAALGDAPYYVRTHFMFCTGNCHGTYKFGSTNIYWENPEGEAVYDFTYYDKIIDALLDTGNKPFVELGFMPEALVDTNYLTPVSGGWERYNQYKESGWTCPPKDYDKWHAFIWAVVSHLTERYGKEEVASWYFELWNEPDIFYWKGTAAEYCKLFDFTEHAVHAALPEARLSGPAVTGIFEGGHAQKFFDFFLAHCKEGTNYCTQTQGTRLDFITFHVKGGGFPFEMHAKKAVPSVESLVHQVKLGLDSIVKYGFGDREVVLSEADPDGWAAGGVYDNANMIFRNTEYYATYVASTYEKIDRLCSMYQIKVRPLAWAFLFPGERCFEGTRTFTTQGIDKAVFNLFKIYGQLGDEKLQLESDGARSMDFLQEPDIGIKNQSQYTGEGEDTDVSGFAVRGKDGRIQIVLYSHNNDRDKEEELSVTVHVTGLSAAQAGIQHFRIDAEHSNPYAEWVRQGKPLFPEGEQYQAIKRRDGLERLCGDTEIEVTDNAATLCFAMPAHAVSFIVVEEKR